MGNPLLTVISIAAVAGAGWAGWQLAVGPPFAGSTGEAGLYECRLPTHHDGDAIRCDGERRSKRLASIDAPEMPGACRPGRACTPGDPYASRDHLSSLTRGKAVKCRQIDTDHYGRDIVQCFADGVDLSCRMVRDGYAVERYGRLDC